MSNSREQLKILSREDSLEYFIKFPSANTRECFVEENSNGFSLSNTKAVPIVLLLGWAGCQDRYLMKYSKIYEEKGLITVRYTAPVENIFWKRNGMKPLGQRVVKLFHDMNLESHPVIVHLFSNGGAYLYQHIDLAAKEMQFPLDICGVVFDSAPGDRRILGLFRAITNIYGKERRFSQIISGFITFGMVIRWIVEDILKLIKGAFRTGVIVETNPYVSLQQLPELTPQLFLYSDEDQLIPAVDIERFARKREECGASVECVRFPGAEHVKLYIQDPEKYVSHVLKFLAKCLKYYEENFSDRKVKKAE